MAKNEKRILMPFDNLQTGKETEYRDINKRNGGYL